MSYSYATVEKTKIPLFKRFEIYYPSWKDVSPKELKKMIVEFLESKSSSTQVPHEEISQFLEDVQQKQKE